jgi:hypothetical protein
MALASGADPVKEIAERARIKVYHAIEAGWSGPPFDPFLLADYMKIPLIAREDIRDARTVPVAGSRLHIEYNPNRPRARVRFSVAHELAHTLFPDCRERVRNRVSREHMQADDWQLEMLCNIAAGEFLMPVGSFPELKGEVLTIDNLLRIRDDYDVSSEAVLLRFSRLTSHPCVVFAASRRETNEATGPYSIDYAIHSSDWDSGLRSGTVLPEDSMIRECTAIGFTAKGDELWPQANETLHIECVGVSPYPTRSYPRVVGIAQPKTGRRSAPCEITYLKGDALQPRGNGNRVIAHIVNDKASTWGAGFARAVRNKLPAVQGDFTNWATVHKHLFKLGNARLSKVSDSLFVFSMICQHGYGEVAKPRVRYDALQSCLYELANVARDKEATVHMPRIGCGQAGGRWEVVSELIYDALCRHGITVTVYDLPYENRTEKPIQRSLF